MGYKVDVGYKASVLGCLNQFFATKKQGDAHQEN
jgi:hypothetical protein